MLKLDVLAAELNLWANETEQIYRATKESKYRGDAKHLRYLAATLNQSSLPSTGVTSFNTRVGDVVLSSLDVTTALGYNPVTQARTLTINGVTYDLSANRSWTISTAIPTLAQVTTAGNTTTNSITVGGLTANNKVYLGSNTPHANDATNIVTVNGIMSLSNGYIRIDGQNRVQISTSGWTWDTAITPTAKGYQGYSIQDFTLRTGSTSYNLDLGLAGQTNLRIANTTGNVLINTTTDAGYKLDVNGTARVNNIFYVTNSAFTGILRIEAFANNQQRIVGAYGENITWGAGGNTINLNATEVYVSQSFLGTYFWIRPDGSFCLGQQAYSDASALLDMRSTTRGFLQPRMTNAQALAITTPATGLQVYDTTNNKNLLYNGTTWQNIATESWVSGQGYLTSTPTLAQVTTAGNTTTNAITVGGLTVATNLIYTDTVNGRVGIGTTGLVPGILLTINGSVSISAGQSLSLDASANIYMVAASSQFRVYTGAIAALSIANTGNVLINTTTDSGYKLDVVGTGRFSSTLTIATAATDASPSNSILITTANSGNGGRISWGDSNTSILRYSNSLYFREYTGNFRFESTGSGAALVYISSVSTSVLSGKFITSGSTTAASALAQGVYFNNTLVAAANNDVLVGLDINPTFTNGAFTTPRNIGLRVQSGRVVIGTDTGSAYPPTLLVASNQTLFSTTPAHSGLWVTEANSGNYAKIQFFSNSYPSNFSVGQTGTTYTTGMQNKSFLHSNTDIWFTLSNSGSPDVANHAMILFNATKNISINSTTDAGYKLDVNGQFRANGESILASASGNVGIGTVSPTSKLHINGADPFLRVNNVGSANTHGIKISYNSSDTQGFHLLYNPAAAVAYLDNTYLVTSGQPYGDIYFRQNVSGTMTTRMTIKADGGNVGIGTTSPIYNLEVSSVGYTGFGIMSGANNTAEIGFQNRGYGLPRWTIRATGAPDGSSGELTFQRLASSFDLTIKSTGNVLIGTTTDAGYKLDVNGTARVLGTHRVWKDNQIGDIDLNLYNGQSGWQGGMYYHTESGGFNQRLTLYSGGVIGTADALTITASSRNVGIGTTTPTAKLQIKGTGDSSVWVTTDDFNTGSNTGSVIRIGTRSSTGNTQGWIDVLNSGVSSYGNLILTGFGGNVLIGTTTDAGYKLDVNGSTRIKGTGTTDSTIALLVQNNTGRLLLQSDDGGFTRIGGPTARLYVGVESGGAAARLVVNGEGLFSNGGIGNAGGFYIDQGGTSSASRTIWYDGSGTPKNLITGNGDNYITSGNFGLGTTTPTDKLHIVDNTNGNKFGRISAGGTDASAAWVAQNDQVDNVVYRVFGSAVTGSQMGQALARSASLIANLGGTGKFLIGSYSGTDLIFGTSDQARMRLVDSTGNFLIGTMTDNGNKLTVSGNIDAQGYKVNNVLGFTGIFNVPTNPPGQQNLDIQGGIVVNVF